MKTLTGVLTALLLAVGSWCAPLAAQAAEAAGVPVIRYPVDGGGVTVNYTYYVEVGFEDAPDDVYTITANELDGTVLDSSTFDSSTGSSRGVEFAPLTQLGEYFLRVLRSDGSVAAESRFSAVPRDPRPPNPEVTGAVVGSREATLSWFQRPDPGLGPLTGFEVQLDRSIGTRQAIAPSSRSFRFTGLTNDHWYRLWVRAVNAGGHSQWVDASVMPHRTDGRPWAPRPGVIDRPRRSTMTWSYEHGSNGGSRILGYQVQRGSSAGTRRNLAPRAREHLFAHLANGRRYWLFVRSQNANGFSGWGRVSARPDRRPSPPPRVHATARSHRVTLHWGASRGGVGPKAAIDWYQVTRGTHGADRHNLSADARSHVFRGLTNGVRYRFYVRAWNRISYGRWSRVSARPHS